MVESGEEPEEVETEQNDSNDERTVVVEESDGWSVEDSDDNSLNEIDTASLTYRARDTGSINSQTQEVQSISFRDHLNEIEEEALHKSNRIGTMQRIIEQSHESHSTKIYFHSKREILTEFYSKTPIFPVEVDKKIWEYTKSLQKRHWWLQITEFLNTKRLRDITFDNANMFNNRVITMLPYTSERMHQLVIRANDYLLDEYAALFLLTFLWNSHIYGRYLNTADIFWLRQYLPLYDNFETPFNLELWEGPFFRDMYPMVLWKNRIEEIMWFDVYRDQRRILLDARYDQYCNCSSGIRIELYNDMREDYHDQRIIYRFW
jgi:hypothetical protein